MNAETVTLLETLPSRHYSVIYNAYIAKFLGTDRCPFCCYIVIWKIDEGAHHECFNKTICNDVTCWHLEGFCFTCVCFPKVNPTVWTETSCSQSSLCFYKVWLTMKRLFLMLVFSARIKAASLHGTYHLITACLYMSSMCSVSLLTPVWAGQGNPIKLLLEMHLACNLMLD